MPKREPNFKDFQVDGVKYVAVGAAHPSEPVQGTITGTTHRGYTEAVLVYPGGLSPKLVKTLELSEVATCALRLRDNLLGRPNRLSRVGGPLEAKEVTWVLCEQDGFFFKPIAAQVGDEAVNPALLADLWSSIESA